MNYTVGIIGGGVAGSTIAIKLSQLGIKTVLFEAGPSLINGPPMCHLHAGGALYRQIPLKECLKLLTDSINTLKLYKFSQNVRPTLLTVPKRDAGEPDQIIKRMNLLTKQYEKLIQQDKSNAVLGDPSDYFRVFSKQQVYRLRQMEIPIQPKTVEDWLIPPAKYLDLQKLKFPFIMVNQYGLSSIRVSAFANLALSKSKHCKVYLNTAIKNVKKIQNDKWLLTYKQNKSDILHEQKVDFLINACGYKTGQIDDMIGYKKKRLVEFKAAYICKWNECIGKWPQIVFHGIRKTPEGMAQLTPYNHNYFQIHGMTQEITLFKNGLVESNDASSQPKFQQKVINKILNEGWDQDLAIDRTRKAIEHVAHFLPNIRTAIQTKKPLYGAQQIPGTNPDLRATSVTFVGDSYARAQIVKASTAIQVAMSIIQKLKLTHKIKVNTTFTEQDYDQITLPELLAKAEFLAKQRNYPIQLGQFYN